MRRIQNSVKFCFQPCERPLASYWSTRLMNGSLMSHIKMIRLVNGSSSGSGCQMGLSLWSQVFQAWLS
jgi:hypothetical protein